jgi:hypothetical protein
MFKTISITESCKTNTRTRLTHAICDGGRVTLLYNRKRSSTENYTRAANQLKKKMKWRGNLYDLGLCGDEYVYALMPDWMPKFSSFCEEIGISWADGLEALRQCKGFSYPLATGTSVTRMTVVA